MTISQIYDRLLAKPVRKIEWRDGSSPLRTVEAPIVVRDVVDADVRAQAWIDPTPQGLILHFNAEKQPGGGLRAQEEPLANILRVE